MPYRDRRPPSALPSARPRSRFAPPSLPPPSRPRTGPFCCWDPATSRRPPQTTSSAGRRTSSPSVCARTHTRRGAPRSSAGEGACALERHRIATLRSPCRLVARCTASAHLSNAQALAHGRPNTTAAQIDVKDEAALDALVAAHDLIIRSGRRHENAPSSLVPNPSASVSVPRIPAWCRGCTTRTSFGPRSRTRRTSSRRATCRRS